MDRGFLEIGRRYKGGIVLAGGAILNIVLWVFVFTLFPTDTPAAILHYSVGAGVDFIGEGRRIMVLPIVGTAVIVLNSAMAYGLRGASIRAVWLFLGIIPVIQVALLTAFALLLRVN